MSTSPKFSRRNALQSLGALVGTAALAGCASEEPEEVAPEASQDEFAFCIGKKAPIAGSAALRKYDKFVVLMMENRSFDHYFGHLSMPKSMGGEGRTDVDGLKGTEQNFGPEGAVKVHKATTFALGDIVHEWDPCRTQFNGGRNDGFVRSQVEDLAKLKLCGEPVDAARGPQGGRCGAPKDAMAYYGREETPVFHQMLKDYALCDRWFSSILGPTWPNRYYLNCGTAFGAKGSAIRDIRALPTTRTIFEALKDRCATATNFYADVPWSLATVGRIRNLAPVFDKQAKPDFTGVSNGAVPVLALAGLQQSFERRCKEGTLPELSIIDPKFLGASNDNHAPTDIRMGQAFVLAIYNMLKSNLEQWQKTLFIITYDEHGGLYDHVKPPTTFDEDPEFRQLGFRVPTLLIGPYVKQGIIKNQYDHTSILSTLTKRFDLDPLNERVNRTADLGGAIDLDRIESAPGEPAALKPMSLSFKGQLSNLELGGWHSDFAALGIKEPTFEDNRKDLDILLENLDRVGAVSVGR